ncbi:hypothetical protein [Mucilaginibacter ginsenosidivorax]|uniref:Lipoprotein n=1 Tax=Mucilaginibacter ginsenosidivorax TaxID=862126 RepID=A0A5B8W699_9SPHI|nr:hypothetical protein [Mucilaginibacter ginsenosidivorax]QEC79333.1 hypothetical protein FSB76_26540 [Mucilaginibacter ginsenosidivorax]
MKRNLLFISMALTVLIGITVLIISCKKDKQKSGCTVQGGGINQEPQAVVMFYLMTDSHCGPITFNKIVNQKTGSDYYPNFSGKIDRFYDVAPACGTNNAGTVVVSVEQGYSYTYTLSCTGKTYTGTVTVNCGETCKAVELK